MVVIPNHLGSSRLDDMKPKGQVVADAVGCRVLVFDRPGSGARAWDPADRELLQQGHAQAVARTARQLSGILQAEGVRSLHLAGQSSAGIEVAALTASEILPVSSLTFMDGVGLHARSALGGLFGYARHLFHELQNGHAPGRGETASPDPTATRPRPLAYIGVQAMRSAAELIDYRAAYLSAGSRDHLLYIARRMPEVMLSVQLVDNTFTTTPLSAAQIARALHKERHRCGPMAQPIHSAIHRGTYHSHFDPPSVFAGYVRETYQLSEQSI